MKVLVLGANGFIGKAFVDKLISKGIQVRALTRTGLKDIKESIETIIGDLTSKDFDFKALVYGCDVVVNCAGETQDDALMYALHVQATVNLLEAVACLCRTGREIHWVQLSSVGAYGGSKESKVVTEETPTNPSGTYEVTKTMADTLIMACNENSGFSYTILRPSNVFGRDMTNESLRQLGRVVKKRVFFFVGFSPSIATYIHVDDVVSALYLCAIDSRAKGHIFNVSNDCPLKELITGIAEALGVPPPRLTLPERPVRIGVAVVAKLFKLPVTQKRIDALVRRTTYPTDKLSSVLGFSPKKVVPTAIQEIY
ncbi:NAD(P)-dependent oxidoreductase [Pseudomonas sp. MAFF 311095]|uniref:NAD(P)-dependent oxidoreductase n=1 Tax=Pseudomonas petroselini TaxID=2899822 RepID=A0ABS8QY36_9PSED|nr:NAD(P)-dependent oxidoreductase [Pseudomonas petroselini]MCD7040371.1 NAD(P)-dependent oxidoreductase [Pseudomonas petroselini]MCD7045592.1 NAD(P)-dependent oxidoreductase [Pseudomonas petroselini]MCD7069013.1 NAD(P)-dependent oxidoreductase [Pseudomonas petroselini]MCD7079638.1 NAD(P)-dependent oxidoreductase [Pseudomonas petroselini]